MIRFGIAVICIAIPLSTLLLADCKWNPEQVESEPRDEGTVTDKGYYFHYQSGRRKADSYRLFRVRNHKNGLFTPIKWTDMGEVLIDCNIPDARTGNIDWICVTKSPNPGYKVVKQPTELAYGANKDEFKQTLQAFVERPKKAINEFPPLVTTLSGKIAVHEKTAIDVSFRVKCEVIKNNTIIQYTFESLGDYPAKAAIVVSAKDDIPESADVAILWQSKRLGGLAKAIVKDKRPVLGREKPNYVATVVVSSKTNKPTLDREATFSILSKEKPDFEAKERMRIASTTASAYVVE